MNTIIALALGASWPSSPALGGALVLGFVSYGVSLTLFVLALRQLGTARTGAYFSTAPFVGAAVSLLVFRERPTLLFGVAAAVMALGVWLHLTERHEHVHVHDQQDHAHAHVHDEHHRHAHTRATHRSRIRSLTFIPIGTKATVHSHPHYPDVHHRHDHD